MKTRLISTILLALVSLFLTSCGDSAFEEAFQPIKHAHINSITIEHLPGDAFMGTSSLSFDLYRSQSDLRSSTSHSVYSSSDLPLRITFEKRYLIETSAYVLASTDLVYLLDAVDQNGNVRARMDFVLAAETTVDTRPSTVVIEQDGMRVTLDISWKNSGPVTEG